MIPTRLLVWLSRHPMSAVFLALALLAGTTWGIANAFTPRTVRSGQAALVETGVAHSVLPAPTQSPPRGRVDEAHRALHAVARACKQPLTTRKPDAIRRPVSIMEDFARDYPRGGFTMDGEPGSALALLIVLRSELQGCEPSLLSGVEAAIPQEYRDP